MLRKQIDRIAGFSIGLRFAKVGLFLSIGLVFLAQSALAQYGSISVEELHRKMESGEKLNIIEVRDFANYAEFNLGGRNIAVGSIQAQDVERIDDLQYEEVILIAEGGNAAGEAASVLSGGLGWPKVKFVEGGILAWKLRYGENRPAAKPTPEPTPAPTPTPQPKAPEPPKFVMIYVGNLAAATTEEDLRNVFAEYGEVKSVKIGKDKSGKPVGYIEMPASGADAAIEALNEGELDGNALEVKKAEPDKRQ